VSELRKAAQQALEDICGAKLCEFNSMSSRQEMVRLMDSAITALRAALAEPEQEPVAWVYPEGLEALKAGKPWTAYGRRQEPNNTALYLSPQPDIAPYAWVTFTPYGDEDDVWYENPEGELPEGWTYKPLYDTAPPRRAWVDLTEVEIDEICLGDEAKVRTALQLLKEKNT